MDWEAVRAFEAVSRRGTLAAAADELELNASTVHRRIASMEEALGARLFTKTPRGYQLTAVGEEALPHAESATEAILSLQRAVVGHDRNAQGTVRLTLPVTLLPTMAPLLIAFRETCPTIDLDIRASTSLLDLRRDVDVALRITAVPPQDAIAHRLATVPWGHYRNPTAGSDARWVVLRGFDRIPAVRDWQRPSDSEQTAFTVDSVADARDLLRTGPYQGVLPTYCAQTPPELVPMRDEHPDKGTGLWLLIHVDLRRSARVRAFVDDLRSRCAVLAIAGLNTSS